MDQINKRLNDFIHWNGIDFYNDYRTNNLHKHLNDLEEILFYLITSFVYLNAILNPGSIMSNSYIEHLEIYGQNIDALKYEVAPFIKDFLIMCGKIIGPDTYEELKNLVPMNL